MEKPVEYLSSTVDTVTDSLDKNMGWLNDKTITNVVLLGLVVYTAFFIGKVWTKGMDMFKHPLVKVISFLLIAYIATKNTALALVATITVIVIMMTNLKNTNEFLTYVSPHKLTTDDDVYEAIMGRCICRCNDNNCKCECKDNYSEELDINQIMVKEEMENELKPEQQYVKKSGLDDYQEMNQNAIDNIKVQLQEHEQDIERSRVSTCDKMPFYKKQTPFSSWSYFNPKLTLSTLDADYSPVNFV